MKYGNTTGRATLDSLGDDERVSEVCKDKDPSGNYAWNYTALLVPGWATEHGEHFIDGNTVADLRRNFRAATITKCECEECSDGKGR